MDKIAGPRDLASAEKSFDVHVFTVVRVKVKGVKAVSQTDAIRKANYQIAWDGLFQKLDHDKDFLEPRGIADVEWGEEHSHYLVDEAGDEEYRQSRYYLDEQHRRIEKELAGASYV